MDWSSWFRRGLLKSNSTNTQVPLKHQQSNRHLQGEESEQELYGITQQLIDHIKSFTLDTFKNFNFPEDEGPAGVTFDHATQAPASANVQKDLSQWQEQHALLVLSKVKELSQLRFMLCPRYLKERQFWRIYFMLVKSHIAEYELQAIRLAKLESMAIKKESSSNFSAIEVEMAETKNEASLAPPTP
ncbi:hypothetical protein K2173_017311 [Erythroxylum novogranatense]|uniref:BSD domain-containing protein n=1 Tax=Erythroxylum novogranatense TaxID=1862640 RepID=A0AAV8UB58_9ROSI|nr:hypothetical protein K2173_017311 [Erythroxylum novogranatense]